VVVRQQRPHRDKAAHGGGGSSAATALHVCAQRSSALDARRRRSYLRSTGSFERLNVRLARLLLLSYPSRASPSKSAPTSPMRTALNTRKREIDATSRARRSTKPFSTRTRSRKCLQTRKSGQADHHNHGDDQPPWPDVYGDDLPPCHERRSPAAVGDPAGAAARTGSSRSLRRFGPT
jgi:hypothetical protein